MTGNVITKITGFIYKRFPDRENLLGLYAVIVFIIYSWMLFTSFYKLPSWILHFTVIEILSLYAYAFSVNFLESVFVLICLLLLDYTLFLFLTNREEFQARAVLVAVILLASSMRRLMLFQEYSDVADFVSGEFNWWAITIAICLPVSIFAPKFSIIRNAIREIADRTSIFLYVYLPLSFISIVVVIIRNIPR